MIGTKKLHWLDDVRAQLGMKLLLIGSLARKHDFAINFGHEYRYSVSKLIAGLHAMNRQVIIPFLREFKAYVFSRGATEPRLVLPPSSRVFIVHGHDGEARERVARFLGNNGFEPIILHKQANRGRTVIEKVETNSDVAFAVVLLTADDKRRRKGADALRLALVRTCYLNSATSSPSSTRASVHAQTPSPRHSKGLRQGRVGDDLRRGGWKQSLGRELEAADHAIEWNGVMRG